MAQLDTLMALMMEMLEPKANDAHLAIPLGISNRHLHLCQKDLEALFGQGYKLQELKPLSQPGQYACKETVVVCGPRGALEKVRILGPVRKETQVEVLLADGYRLGLTPPVRMSGNLEGTPGVTLVGPNGSVQTRGGLIVAQRHIHMTGADAARFGVADGQMVSICVDGPRGGLYGNVRIRATEQSKLECHLDMEEANAMGLAPASYITIHK